MGTILTTCDRLANSKNQTIAKAWERYRAMIYLAADSGMRPQEYIALPIPGLLQNGVRVIQAVDRSNRIGPPKTQAGRRFIPVGADTLDMVRRYAQKHGQGDLVFPSRDGGGCPSSKRMGLVSFPGIGGLGSSGFEVKPLGCDGANGGFGWSFP